MNCGCGQPHDDHGKHANITAADLLRASDANDQTMRESAKHITEALDLLVARLGPGSGDTAGSRRRASIWTSPSRWTQSRPAGPE